MGVEDGTVVGDSVGLADTLTVVGGAEYVTVGGRNRLQGIVLDVIAWMLLEPRNPQREVVPRIEKA